ncbi:VOC family protein [Polyangium aurulentum]|uniref:VOC family protein n=1 Tax=Polyangium aurulentum TaxID=2567896 RepID=UPI00146DBDE7|nr:VOC family protein [Polyangium aurulentum]UQA60582.1 VOC family protein [Polyangium aurulentum]
MELDHVVLEVKDPAGSAAFYEAVLRFAPVRLDEFQNGKASFVSVRLSRGVVLDLFPPRMWRGPEARNPNHLCFTFSRKSFRALEGRLSARGIPITKTADHNFGARGFGHAIYFDDPDGISLEARYYPS